MRELYDAMRHGRREGHVSRGAHDKFNDFEGCIRAQYGEEGRGQGRGIMQIRCELNAWKIVDVPAR